MTQRELLEMIARGESDLVIELQQELIAAVARMQPADDEDMNQIIREAREMADYREEEPSQRRRLDHVAPRNREKWVDPRDKDYYGR